MNGVVDATGPAWPEPAEVRAHLERVLASTVMARSASLSSFLRFVVEETLAGRGDRLKARVIAVGALGRDESFNSKTDPIVSMQASRLRKALADYYNGEGHDEVMRLELPKGDYQPKFRQVDDANADAKDGKMSSSAGRTVAVVPLVDLDAGGVADYFAVGLTQEIVAALANFRELTVMAVPPLAADASLLYAASELGRKSDARFVLTGMLRRTVTTLVLRMQLTDAASASVVWTDKIKRPLTAPHPIDLEEEVAGHLTRAIADIYGVIHRILSLEAHGKQTEP